MIFALFGITLLRAKSVELGNYATRNEYRQGPPRHQHMTSKPLFDLCNHMCEFKSYMCTGRDGAATKVITVGFPADKNLDFPRTMKPVPIYAEGYAKAYGDEKIYYNIGSINGNSGGAVLRADDHRIVRLTNGGARNYGQGGWDHNDPEDRDAWNFGAAMHLAYANSVIECPCCYGRKSEVSPDGLNPEQN